MNVIFVNGSITLSLVPLLLFVCFSIDEIGFFTYISLIKIIDMKNCENEYSKIGNNRLSIRNFNNLNKIIQVESNIRIKIENQILNNKMIYLKRKSGSGKTTIINHIIYHPNINRNKISFFNQDYKLFTSELKIQDIIIGFEMNKNHKILEEVFNILDFNQELNWIVLQMNYQAVKNKG